MMDIARIPYAKKIRVCPAIVDVAAIGILPNAIVMHTLIIQRFGDFAGAPSLYAM